MHHVSLDYAKRIPEGNIWKSINKTTCYEINEMNDQNDHGGESLQHYRKRLQENRCRLGGPKTAKKYVASIIWRDFKMKRRGVDCSTI